MSTNQKLTRTITGRIVQLVAGEPGKVVVTFDDGSTMTVRTTVAAPTIASGKKVGTVIEDGREFILRFEDGSSVTLQLADPGASVAVRDQGNAVKYLG